MLDRERTVYEITQRHLKTRLKTIRKHDLFISFFLSLFIYFRPLQGVENLFQGSLQLFWLAGAFVDVPCHSSTVCWSPVSMECSWTRLPVQFSQALQVLLCHQVFYIFTNISSSQETRASSTHHSVGRTRTNDSLTSVHTRKNYNYTLSHKRKASYCVVPKGYSAQCLQISSAGENNRDYKRTCE